MTNQEMQLAASLLYMAADVFSNHGCNDFDLTKVIPDPETRNAFVERFIIESYGEDELQYFSAPEAGEPDWRCQDWGLMRFMADRLEEASKSA